MTRRLPCFCSALMIVFAALGVGVGMQPALGQGPYEGGDLFLEYGAGVDHMDPSFGDCPPPGEVMDPRLPIDLEPGETVSWHEVYPNDGTDWTMSRHLGQPGGPLMPGDDISMYDGATYNSYYVVDITITIWVTRKLPDIVETLALELSPPDDLGYYSIDAAMSDPFFPPAQWHQIWPPQDWCTIYNTVQYEDNYESGISCSDQIGLIRKPDGVPEFYHIDAVTTDIILVKKPPPVPQQRVATWPYVEKGYVIDYYVYTNSHQGRWHIAEAGFKMPGGSGHAVRRYKPPFTPDDLFIIYHWQNQENVYYIEKMWAAAKGGAFRWTFEKDESLTDLDLLTCQDPDGIETFCLRSFDVPPPEDAPIVCQDPDVDCDGVYPGPPPLRFGPVLDFEDDPHVCCYEGFETGCDLIPVQMCLELGGQPRHAGMNCSDSDENGVADACEQIPAVSEWGLVVMALLVLAAGTVVLRRWRQLAVKP